VSIQSPPPAIVPATIFPRLLKSWRQKRRLSQLELALESGVSQRHLSFLESGRSRPSREMILQLSHTLGIPLRERNDWLLAAGFAPLFQTRSLDDPHMLQVLGAVRLMLGNHEPYPALALDRVWNIRLANAPFERLVTLLDSDLWSRIGKAPRNVMRLFFHPEGLRPFVTNWGAVAPLLWHRVRREAEAVGGQDLQALLAELHGYVDTAELQFQAGTSLIPVLPLVLEKDGLRLSLFSVIATFGTAQDVTTDELRIESLFPADDATELLFRASGAPETA